MYTVKCSKLWHYSASSVCMLRPHI